MRRRSFDFLTLLVKHPIYSVITTILIIFVVVGTLTTIIFGYGYTRDEIDGISYSYTWKGENCYRWLTLTYPNGKIVKICRHGDDDKIIGNDEDEFYQIIREKESILYITGKDVIKNNWTGQTKEKSEAFKDASDILDYWQSIIKKE